MNLSAKMIPGLVLLLAGAVLTFGAGRFRRKEEDVHKMKMTGVLLAALGAVLVFLV